MLDLVNTEGRRQGDHDAAAPPAERAQVIDLMDALKESLAKRASDVRAEPLPNRGARRPHQAAKREYAAHRLAETGTESRKVTAFEEASRRNLIWGRLEGFDYDTGRSPLEQLLYHGRGSGGGTTRPRLTHRRGGLLWIGAHS